MADQTQPAATASAALAQDMAKRRMLQFVAMAKSMPEKRAAIARCADFSEIYASFAPDRASQQASRCSQCGVPFCQVHCPLHNNIPDWLKLTAEGRLDEAYELSQATNSFPEICGRICPQDRLCEGHCVIGKNFEAVTIGAVEKFITDHAWQQGWVQAPRPLAEREESVGIVGAGPAGLAAAERLRRLGYRVDLYDRYDRPGGLMIYGIPGFKLDKEIVQRRTRLLVDGGVRFHLNLAVGRHIGLAELRQRHVAVLIATGVYKARDISAPGASLKGVVPALSYLTANDRAELGDDVPELRSGTLCAGGKDVVVVGGGDTAMDCVRTAIRQGARSVKCLYRRNRANMPGSQREVANAEEEGVEFVWLSAPTAFIGQESVDSVEAERIHLGLPDASGRQTPVAITGSTFTLKADLAITALGFDPEDLPCLFDAPDLAVTRWGTVMVDAKTQMTSLDGVFAAGDIVRGASLVVWAIRDGQEAAHAIHRWREAQKRAQPLAG